MQVKETNVTSWDFSDYLIYRVNGKLKQSLDNFFTEGLINPLVQIIEEIKDDYSSDQREGLLAYEVLLNDYKDNMIGILSQEKVDNKALEKNAREFLNAAYSFINSDKYNVDKNQLSLWMDLPYLVDNVKLNE